MRQICILFPWYRTAFREFVVTVFHPGHQKLLPPLVHTCKGRITISMVNSRDPLECLWLPFTDLSVKAWVHLSTIELISCQFILKALTDICTSQKDKFLQLLLQFSRIFSFLFLFLLAFSRTWIDSDLWMVLIKRQRFARRLFLGNQSHSTLWAWLVRLAARTPSSPSSPAFIQSMMLYLAKKIPGGVFPKSY